MGPDEVRESEAEGIWNMLLKKERAKGAERRGQEEFSQINFPMPEAPRGVPEGVKKAAWQRAPGHGHLLRWDL